MKKIIAVVILLTTVIYSCNSQVKSSKNIDLGFLVGTYTDNDTQGINYIKFDSSTNKIALQSVIKGVKNPSFVIANKAKTVVVAVEETGSANGGKITSFAFNSATKAFQKINSVYTKGDDPCSVAFSPKENFVVVGNYTGGNLSVFAIDKSGKLSESLQVIQHEGKSVNTSRQEKPHVHCIVFHPTENKIFIADLGNDSVQMIPYNANGKLFLEQNKAVTLKVTEGSGPRHLKFNKAGTKLYVVYELTNEIAVFDYKNNELKLQQTIALTPLTKSGSSAELKLSDDDKFLYASTRGEDNILTVMKTNLASNIEIIQTIKTQKTPRNFIIAKGGNKVLVAHQNSNSILVFDRDNKTGLLKATGDTVFEVNKPVYFCPF